MSIYARGGYLDQKTRSPLSLGAAIAINGAVLGAVLFANPGLIPEKAKIFEAIIVKDPPVPEPLPPPPQPRDEVPTKKPVIDTTIPLISDPPIGYTIPYQPPQPPLPLGNENIGTGTVIDPPRPPVFVGPQLDSRYAAALQPPYPPGKIRAEEEGVVVVRVRIGPDGRVKEVQKVQAADDAFYRATVEQAMKRWRFKPATSDGTPVEGWRTMTVRFELDS